MLCSEGFSALMCRRKERGNALNGVWEILYFLPQVRGRMCYTPPIDPLRDLPLTPSEGMGMERKKEVGGELIRCVALSE